MTALASRVDIAGNLAAIERRIAQACAASGRARDEVRLLPVSKTFPVAAILAAVAAGYHRFGENRVQEVVAKNEELGPDSGVEFAVIGPLQSNKAGKLAALAVEFQALDSLRIAAVLDRRLEALERNLDVLVQVNSSGETTKSGLAPADVVAFAGQLVNYPRLRPRGLMTLALPGPDMAAVAACFERMRQVQAALRAARIPGVWDELSMGMSGDFELAIAHGATCVRIGTAIFGGR